MKKLISLLLLMSYSVIADDNEIYVDQVGATANLDLEQLGSGNIIGGLLSTHGSMTPFDLDGTAMTLDVNQIGNNNKMLGDINSDTFTGVFDFDGDTNSYTIQVDPTNTYSADNSNVNVDVDGNTNTFTLDLATASLASGADIDWIIQGDSNQINSDLDVDSATQYIDLDGDSNTVTYDGDGYAGAYFKLEQDGNSRAFTVDQQSTLDNDWLRINSWGSNGTICVNQDDHGTSVGC